MNRKIAKLILMTAILHFGTNAHSQQTNLDSLEFTTAKVALVESGATPCHFALSYFTFKVLKHIDGPVVEEGTLISTMNLNAYVNGDGTKIWQELKSGKEPNEGQFNSLIINFTHNPKPKFSVSDYGRMCGNSDNYFDYGISYTRWAVGEERFSTMTELDAFLNYKFNKKFHLMAERRGIFVFEHDDKEFMAFKRYNDWELVKIDRFEE